MSHMLIIIYLFLLVNTSILYEVWTILNLGVSGCLTCVEHRHPYKPLFGEEN